MHLRALFAVVVALLFLSGCQSRATASEVKVQCEIAPRPVRTGPAEVTVALTGQTGRPLIGAAVNVEGDMAHPGMAPVFVDARPDGRGRYAATVNFSMPGDWVLLIHATLPDGRKLERQVRVAGVEAR